TRTAIRQDISELQRSESDQIFQAGFALFDNKWRSKKHEDIDSFLDYFTQQWIYDNKGWYEGFAPGKPSTDNALEANNDVIKDDVARQRQSLGRFLVTLEDELVKYWSTQRSPTSIHQRVFSTV